MSKISIAAIYGTLAATEDSDRTRKQPRRQKQNKRYREDQVRPVLYEAYPDWRNGVPSKAEMDPREYLHLCRRAVWKNQSTHHLLSGNTDPCLDKTFKRIRDGH